MNILVSGSIAYDRIMDFPGYFSEHILPEKIHVLNVSFTVNRMIEKFGGTAGNIAYALHLMGEKPIILATIGRDHHRYFEWLTENQIDIDTIKIIEDEFTASAFITTDLADNQITGFNPGSMKYPSEFDFDSIRADDTIAIVAPGNVDDMINYSRTCRKMEIDYIFDPGQSLPMWNGEKLLKSLDSSRVLISNDYELDLIIDKTGLNKNALLTRTGAIVTTLGEAGSKVTMQNEEINIAAVEPSSVVDPTGAGDAYRAGLIKGLIQGRSIIECARMGSVCASFAVEQYGTQEYYFSPEEYEERLNRYLSQQ